MAKFVKAESLVRRLATSQDIVDAIVNRQRMANENNKGEQKNLNYFYLSFKSYSLNLHFQMLIRKLNAMH